MRKQTKNEHININCTPDFLNAVNAAAQAKNVSRTQLVRDAVAAYLNEGTVDITPIETCTDEVRIRGDALSPIMWRGKQWAVTTFGIEKLDGTYPIEAKRLLEDLPEHSWIRHMAGKNWVDIAEFTTAFCVALIFHNKTDGVTGQAILDHYDLAIATYHVRQ